MTTHQLSIRLFFLLAFITFDARAEIYNPSTSGGGSGTVTTTGSPASGDLAVFSSSTSITTGTVTGTGSTFVKQTSPTLITPVLGVATATSFNKITLTTPATGATLTLVDGKTLTASNTLTFTGTDASSVDFGTGGTAAYIAAPTFTISATAPFFNATTVGSGYKINSANAINFPSGDTTAGASIAIGSGALATETAAGSTAFKNTAVGYQAMGNGTMTTAATQNTAVGYQAGQNITSGSVNAFFGSQAGNGVTSGVRNTGLGQGACLGVQTTADNTCTGTLAGTSVTGSRNTAEGSQAGEFISSGSDNTAFGFKSMIGINGTRITGSFNTSVGSNAGFALQGGAASNSLFGYRAGASITTGTNNVVVGYQVASTTLTTGGSNILIGASSVIDAASSSTSDTLIIGNNATTPVISSTAINSTPTTTLNGIINMPGLASSSAATTGTVCWTTASGLLNVDTTTTCLLSAVRFKHDIKDSPFGLAEIMKMQPRTFVYNENGGELNLKRRQVGFVAEEMYGVVPELVSLEPNGKDLKSVAYQNITAVLVRAVQEQQVEINELKKHIGQERETLWQHFRREMML